MFYANIVFFLVGILVAFASESFMFSLHNTQTQAVFFDGQALTANTLDFKQFVYGIIGGTIAGFHLLLLFVIHYPFRNKEKWAYYSIWASILCWFCIDSSLSIYHGAFYNVYLINVVALVGNAIPLLATKRYFDL